MILDIVRTAALEGVAHGFFGREGGLFQGPAAGLNCGLGSNDDPAAVRANRRLAADAVLPGCGLASVYQIHSPEAVIVSEANEGQPRPRADALVTDRPGLLLGIVTADCAPVLLADTEAGVVGAAHAGWRGATAGVTDRTIAAMLSLGARIERIAAAVGPCIARSSYEVDHDFADRLLTADESNERFLSSGPGDRPRFDLEAYVVARLAAAGVRRIEAVGLDTYVLADRFYSFRRATHRGEPDYGRQISLIALAPA
ncbi:peptidoglycan editing factor PgeF [Sphingomonas xanthus]|uniref:Purine nucleoside phosphorylase n=1 Tax=Sphingomonas xanthus TaxID=2594473 RepID=A0A516ISD1_9SPHN|nr:peptidoglycan editing factor PgeF [Sphingomonas xanthus]QDP19769.1 peptidoglycan editing factor PgeF [Sphingomonas xanthus]